jgi:hypothetical protein
MYYARSVRALTTITLTLLGAAVSGGAPAQAASHQNPTDLATAALPAASLPGAIVMSQGYGTKSDIAAAGPGITGTYERFFNFPRSKQLVFIDEGLFAASGLDTATAKFNRIRRARAHAQIVGLESWISNAFLLTVVLPVQVHLQRTVSLHAGDSSFEMLFSAHSGCCKFRVAVAVVRVGQLDAVLIIATNGKDGRSQLVASLVQQAADQMSAASTPPPAPTVFSDPAGDSGSAPDVTSVAVANTAAGQITFQVTIANEPTLAPGAAIFVDIDTDQNPATGSLDHLGAEYVLSIVGGPGGGVGAVRWNGSSWVLTPLTSLSASFENGVATIAVDKSELGVATGFNFYLSGQVDTSASSTAYDLAPDTGVWNYQLQ